MCASVYLCKVLLLFTHFVICFCVCAYMCVIVHVSWFSVYLCGLRQRRQSIMNWAFIPLHTAPFTYPHGEDDGVELACQSKCLVPLHAVSVLSVRKGIKLGVQVCSNTDMANLFSILLLWWAPRHLICLCQCSLVTSHSGCMEYDCSEEASWTETQPQTCANRHIKNSVFQTFFLQSHKIRFNVVRQTWPHPETKMIWIQPHCKKPNTNCDLQKGSH